MTQSNAANAEESAEAAEQLNAQAAIMKQSVMELLKLLSGKEHADLSALPNRRNGTSPGPAASPAAPRANPSQKRNGSDRATVHIDG